MFTLKTEADYRYEWETIRKSKGYAVYSFDMPIDTIKGWIKKEKGSIFALLINKLQGLLK